MKLLGKTLLTLLYVAVAWVIIADAPKDWRHWLSLAVLAALLGVVWFGDRSREV